MPLSRRRFVLAVGAAALALPTGTVLADSRLDLLTIQRSAFALGSPISLTVQHADSDLADAAIDAALAELEMVERLMSIYRQESQLSRLNRDGHLVAPHRYLVEVLRQAHAVSVLSGGAFDVTVQPLWELFAAAAARGEQPQPQAIAAVRSAIGFRQVEVADNSVRLADRRVRLTLNGIAQGFAADRVRQCLLDHGIQHAIIDAGELAPIGGRIESSSEAAWKVGIQHPRRSDAYVAIAQLSDRCLATSGDYAMSFSPDFRRHHIFDPTTGESGQSFASVSVLAPTACLADALSTAIMAQSESAAVAMLQRLDNVDALLVRRDGSILSTRGFPFAPEA